MRLKLGLVAVALVVTMWSPTEAALPSLSTTGCPEAGKPLARLEVLREKKTSQAEAQIPEMLEKAFAAELGCIATASATYAATGDMDDLRAAYVAQLRLAIATSLQAEWYANAGLPVPAHESWLEAMDLARFVYDSTTGNPDLTGMRAGAGSLIEEIAADLDALGRVKATDGVIEMESARERIERTQAETMALEADLDAWEQRSKKKTFDGAEVVETLDGSTIVQIKTNRSSWAARNAKDRKATFEIIAAMVDKVVPRGALGHVLRLVDEQGGPLVVTRLPRDLSSIAF